MTLMKLAVLTSGPPGSNVENTCSTRGSVIGYQTLEHLRGSNPKLPISQATQMALVLNELIQNAIEHGFAVTPDGRGLSVQVPAGTVTGSITVVTTDGPTGVGGVFHVLPKLTSISHGGQASHDTDSFSFRLHGEQLSDVVDVQFAGTPVTWSLVDDSEIDVTVPTDGPRWGTFHLTVPSPDGQSIDSPVAGVGIEGSVDRVCDERGRPRTGLVTHVMRAGRSISRELGHGRDVRHHVVTLAWSKPVGHLRPGRGCL